MDRRYTIEQRVRVIQAYYKNGCSNQNAYRALRDVFGQFNRPNVRTIGKIVKKFEQTGSVGDLKTPVHARTSRTAENIAAVRDSVAEEPFTSTRRRAQQLNLSRSSLMNIMHKDLHLHNFSKMAATIGPRPLVICGPSGSGKSTLLKRLFAEYPDTFGFSVSHTTRQPRPGETDGVDYHFVTREIIEQAIANDEFIESACFGGNIYGTSKTSVRAVQAKGKVCVLDIEIEGVKQVKKSNLNPILVFNNPPSIDELKRRLLLRNTENEESLQKRLDAAQTEIDYGTAEGNFNIIINNDVIDEAYATFKDFIISEIKKQQEQGVNIHFTDSCAN